MCKIRKIGALKKTDSEFSELFFFNHMYTSARMQERPLNKTNSCTQKMPPTNCLFS